MILSFIDSSQENSAKYMSMLIRTWFFKDAQHSNTGPMQVIWKHIISWVGIFTRFSIIKKCVSLLALLITSETWQFHIKVLDMITPNIWFGQQVQVPCSWRLQRRTGVGSLEVNNQFFALLWVQLKMLLADHCSNAFTALWIALLLPLEWSKHAFFVLSHWDVSVKNS